ncbi:DUF3299 domain-containing protein [Glaciecola sp. XM2]|jgi:hypothetical protein|uniref:DUF3299 domain-containing protein n=1 Tax=Glaciecola sp. XM2 TaxID=1914931 RepID=UPI001BDE39C5|nr:DUF3299 domain-containing protein [Glaciecola sp. XM2]MBT1450107.1 DUF3299 domain-containing protein [Glaciecola sp. XM2]
MCKKWLVAVVFCLILPFANAQNDTEYEEIEWIVLMPDDDLAALMNPPSYIDDVMEGSPADSLDLLHGGIEEDPRTAPYLKALGSTTVIEEYNGRNIRIPGFIVPLSSDDDQNITEFFIVPYFGACLHLPPPPPNQMLHVKTDKGVQLKSLEDAFWFEGTVKVETTNSMLGTAAYGLELANWMPYE